MAEGKSEECLLIEAIDREDVPYIKFLLNTCEPSVNEPSESGKTPLAAAVFWGNIDIVRMLLESGANCDSLYFFEGGNVLHYAVEHELEEILDELIEKTVSVNERNEKGLTVLMIAAENGNLAILKKLIKSKCEINALDRKGLTAVMISVRNYLLGDRSDEAIECIQELIDAKADLSICDDDGNNALMNLREQWDKDASEVLILLIRAGCDVNCVNKYGDYPLMTACKTDVRHSVLEELIQNGAVVNGASGDDYTPLAHVAGDSIDTENESSQICEILLNAGADPNKGTPVVKAASEGRDCLVQMLLNYGSDINGVDEMYGTVLLMGGWTENHNIVKIALKYNAKINLGQDKVDGLYNYISWPQKINTNKAIMLMAAAGELFPFEDYDDVELPQIFVEVRDDWRLKSLCRKALRKSVIANGTHENMFDAGRILGLPRILQDYLVFGMSMSDESDTWEKPNESDESNKSDE